MSFIVILIFCFSQLYGNGLVETIVFETEAISDSQSSLDAARHHIERGEYFFIGEYYESAQQDLFEALQLLSDQPCSKRAEVLLFRSFLTLGTIFANVQMDSQYFMVLEYLKARLYEKQCQSCRIWCLPSTELETLPSIETVSLTFIHYAFSATARVLIAFFMETLERAAYQCPDSALLWEAAVAPLAMKLQRWKGGQEENAIDKERGVVQMSMPIDLHILQGFTDGPIGR